MTKILIVDDEANIRLVVTEYAKINGFEVDEAENGLQALTMVENEHYDCIVLDIMMPILDGFATCKKIKEITNTPIIMLSARQEEYDKLFGFELGVDDYVTKPFSPKELMARINVAIARSSSFNRRNVFAYHDLIIDEVGRTVKINQQIINLTPKEIDLLLYMVKNIDIALSREQLLSKVWGYDYIKDDRTVDTHIKMLRHKLQDYRDMIVTVRGMGYKFEKMD